MFVTQRAVRQFSRQLAMLLVCLGAAAAGGRPPTLAANQRLSHPLTFSAPAMPADRLLKALSARTGVRLECAPETRAEVLLLRVNDRPLREVMARLAEAAGAKWVPAGPGYRLVRPPAMERAQGEHDLAARARFLARGLGEITAPLTKPWNDQALVAAAGSGTRMRRTGEPMPVNITGMDPAFRLLARCLKSIGPRQLVAIPVNGRVVWATRPTPVQRPLGPAVRQAMRLLVIEQQRLTRAIKKATFGPGREDELLRVFAGAPELPPLGTHSPWERLSPYPAPARLVLAVTRRLWGEYEWNMKGLDRDSRATLEIEGPGHDELRDRPFIPDAAPATTESGGPLVEISPESRRIMYAFATTPGQVAPPGDVALLAHPEDHEPLGGVVSDGYLTLARNQRLNLVASLPDHLLRDIREEMSGRRLPLARFLKWTRQERPMLTARRGNWLVVTPSDPYESRHERADRAALGRIFRHVAAAGRASIDDCADFLAHAGEPAWSYFGGLYLRALAGERMARTGAELNFPRLYGSLDAAQRARLLAGETIRYASLSPEQRRMAQAAVYGPHVSCRARGGKPPDGIGDLDEESTEGFPRGLPPDRGLHACESQQHRVEFLQPGRDGGPEHYWAAIAEESGRMGFVQIPKLPRGGFDALRFRVQPVRNIHFRVDAAPWLSFSQRFSDPPGPPSDPPVPLEKLSPELRRRIEKEIDWLKPLPDRR